MKVLLAIDGSEHSEEAAWLFSHLPHEDKLEITVLTVINVSIGNESSITPKDWMKEIGTRERNTAVKAYEKIAAMFEGANAQTQHVIREGYVGETIVTEAEKIGAEMVVLGARGHSTVGRILLGSTSDFVATHAPCSVFVVRPTGLRKEPDRPLRVAVGYDDSGPSLSAVAQFKEFRWGPQTELHVVTVVPSPSAYFIDFAVDLNEYNEASAAALEQVANKLREVAPNLQSHVIESEHIGEGLVRFIAGQRCDMIVMGDTNRNLLGRMLLGSASRFVLRHASCSVWVTRNRPISNEKTNSDKQASQATT